MIAFGATFSINSNLAMGDSSVVLRLPADVLRPVCLCLPRCRQTPCRACDAHGQNRSEEHTSELQSLMRISYAVFCLKKNSYDTSTRTTHRYGQSRSDQIHTT